MNITFGKAVNSHPAPAGEVGTGTLLDTWLSLAPPSIVQYPAIPEPAFFPRHRINSEQVGGG